MSKHTPGPWNWEKHWEEHTLGFDVFHGDDSSNERDRFVARTDNQANARLIAAAPDLLVAAELAAGLVDPRLPEGIQETLERAITKARGEKQ
jgi:hypothetical protein